MGIYWGHSHILHTLTGFDIPRGPGAYAPRFSRLRAQNSMYNNTEIIFLTTYSCQKNFFGPLAWNLSVRPCPQFPFWRILTCDRSSNPRRTLRVSKLKATSVFSSHQMNAFSAANDLCGTSLLSQPLIGYPPRQLRADSFTYFTDIEAQVVWVYIAVLKMNRHMDWSPQTNCYKGPITKPPDIPNLAESSVSVTSLGDKD